MLDLIIFLILVALGYFIGTFVEKRHYESIEKRERDLLTLPVVPSKNLVETDREIIEAYLVSSSVVISHDYFKMIRMGFRKILGGRIFAYETLLDRARREAILRLKEKIKDADIILNLRLETASIFFGAIEVLAYGTAIYYKK